MRHERAGPWVVYVLPVRGKPDGVRAICSQHEWDAMERDRPGVYTLIRAGVTNEGEAERLARGTSGDPPARTAKWAGSRSPALPPVATPAS